MPVVLIYNGANVASFTLPQIYAAPFVDNNLVLSAPVVVTDFNAFSTFGIALLQNEYVTFTLSGRATVVSGPVRVADIPFIKEVQVAGAQNLVDNYVEVFSLAGSNATTAIVNLTVVANNPSVAIISPLGNLAVDVIYKGAYFGTVIATAVSLNPGPNAFTFYGPLVSTNIELTNDLISTYLGGYPVNVTAVGSTSVPATYPLYSNLLSAINISTQLTNDGIPLVDSVSVNAMGLSPVGLTSVLIDLDVDINVNNILGENSPLNVGSVAIDVELEGGGQPLGRLVADMPNLGTTTLFSSTSSKLLQFGQELPIVTIPIKLSAVLDIQETFGAFSDFILAFLANETVSLGLYSNVSSGLQANLSCALGDLSIGIPVDITAFVPGLNNFSVVRVKEFAVIDEIAAPDAAVIVTLNVSILNPSPATFALGENSTFGIYGGGARLGESVAINATLRPGLNNLTLLGALKPPTASLPQASRIFSDYLNGVDTIVSVAGESVFLGKGQPTPEWLSDAVKSITLSATLPAAEGLTVFSEIDIESLNLMWAPPPDGEGQDVPYISGQVGGNIHLPFSIPVNIPGYSLDLFFNDPDTLAPMASLSLINQPAFYTPAIPLGALTLSSDLYSNYPTVGRLTLILGNTPVNVINTDLFANFISNAVNQDSTQLYLTGTAAPTVSISIGNLSITNISIQESFTIQGLGGLRNPAPIVLNVDITESTPDNITLAVLLNITNPSIISGSFGPVSLDIAYEGFVLSNSFISNLVVVPGSNVVQAFGTFTMPDRVLQPAAFAAATNFISGYLSGIDAEANLIGGPSSSPYPLLQPAFSTINATIPFPGLPYDIVVNGTLYVDVADPANIPLRPNGTLYLHNDLSVDIQLLKASLTVFLCNTQTPDGLDCQTAPFYDDPIGFAFEGNILDTRPAISKAHTIARTKPYPILLLANDNDKVTIFLQLVFGSKHLVTRMNGTLTVKVGEFPVEINFNEDKLLLFAAPPSETPPVSETPLLIDY
jgi:Protein of unknown function (DUF3712)